MSDERIEPTDIVVRAATPDDLAAIGRLGALLVRAHYEFDPRRFIEPTPRTAAGYASYLGSLLESPEIVILVADRAGKVVGYTYAGAEGRDYMSLRGPAGVLYDIVVDPEHRRHGIGWLLLEATLAFLKEQGSPRVVLSTAAQNEPAQHLFASAGFRRTMIEMTAELDDAT